jgi:hypothetical protein
LFYGKVIMGSLALLVIAVIIVLAVFGLGRVLRNRSPLLKIAGTVSVIVVTFLLLALLGNLFGLSVYHYDEVELCRYPVPDCAALLEQDPAYYARVPSLALWMTVPRPLRPACETVSPEFCTIQTTYDFLASAISWVRSAQ